jgi:hypothetical protein
MATLNKASMHQGENVMSAHFSDNFAGQINYELKRAERYRYFVSLIVLNIGPVLDLGGNGALKDEKDRSRFITELNKVLDNAVREVDSISNHQRTRIGLLLPETSRQGAESAARRITTTLYEFCNNYFGKPADYLMPVEISSFPDAAGVRTIASYLEEFQN